MYHVKEQPSKELTLIPGPRHKSEYLLPKKNITTKHLKKHVFFAGKQVLLCKINEANPQKQVHKKIGQVIWPRCVHRQHIPVPPERRQEQAVERLIFPAGRTHIQIEV